MPRDPAKDLAKGMKKMWQKSASRTTPSNGGNRKASGDYFPFLALPDNVISNTFSFLSIADRMRARVNKRLDAIELESKHHVEELRIEEQYKSANAHSSNLDNGDQRIILHKDSSVFPHSRTYSSDSIRRIAQNTSIGNLSIALSGASKFHREVYNLIKNFDMERLNMDFKNRTLVKDVVVGSFLVDLANSCKLLDIENQSINVTAAELHELYKIIANCSAKLRMMWVQLRKGECISFLSLIGITYKNGRFVSKRKIEVKEDILPGRDGRDVYIFDGNMEIAMCDEIMSQQKGMLYLKMHETKESLIEGKNRKLKVNYITL